MSLIQEALRRRGEETGAPRTLKPPVEITPPPLPPSQSPAARRVGLWLFLSVLVVLGVAGGAAWWLIRQPAAKVARKPAPPPAANPPVAPTNPPAVAAKSTVATNASATNNIIAKVRTVLEKTITPERRELVMGATSGAAPSAPAPVKPGVTPAVQPVPQTPPAAAPARKAVRWPKLTVTGIMARGGGDAMVFVNGQMLAGGDELQDVKVIQVTGTGARFLYQGETNFIRVGHSTE